MAITITNVTPAVGPLGQRIQVQITGTNFVSLLRSTPEVLFGGQPATVTGFTATGITVLAPASDDASLVDVTVRTRNGNATSAFRYCDPVLTAVTAPVPARGPEAGGTVLTLTGNYFPGALQVLIGGLAAAHVQVDSLTQVRATTAARPAGQGSVNVRVGSGVAQLLNAFTFVARPVVNGVQLVGGGAAHGSTAGGTPIAIDGAGFEPNAEVRVGGVAATGVAAPTAIRITCTTAAHPAPGAVTVEVRNPQGDWRVVPNGFTYDVTVTTITLNHGPVSGVQDVVIDGGGFVHPAQVTIAGVAATHVVVNSPVQIAARTAARPAGVGRGDVAVQCGGLTGTLADGYTYEPAVTAITPAAGPSCGTQRVQIDGAGFADPVTVRIGAQPATSVVRASATQINCVTPAHAPGPVDVEVVVGGTTGTRTGGYTYAVPTVTTIEPRTARITGGQWATITGTHFVAGGTTVRIGATAATDVRVLSPTEIRCRLPAGAAGAPVNVSVANSDNRPGVGATLFTYVAGPTATGGNDVAFFMDGEEFFGEFERLVINLIAQAGPDKTYLRMAYWMAFGDMTLGAPGDFRNPAHTLLHWIDQIVQAGIDVDVILWYPVGVEILGGPRDENRAFAEGIRDLDLVAAGHAAWGRARAFLEVYEGPPGSSNHQKIAIFSVAGQRTVLLGGFNLAHKYYDQVAHTFIDPTPNQYNHWHDTAVRIIGPATDDIELEWERRWDRAIAQRQSILPARSVIHARNVSALALGLNVTNSVAAVHLARNRDPQTAQGANVSIKTALTRSRFTALGTSYHRELRDTLHDLIDHAAVSVYMENNQFTDPLIVRHLYNQMHNVPGLIVAICTNVHADGPFGWLTRRAWLQLALRLPHPRFTGLTYQTDGAPVAIVRNGLAAFEVQDAYDAANPAGANWFRNEWFRYKQNPLDAWTTVRLAAITRVDGDFYFYTPVREPNGHRLCLHSKLAIIDAQHLVVGTSNWTFRSMQYDGEIAAFIDNAVLAAAVQARLLDHYQQHLIALRANLTRATLANLETVADETQAGLSAPPLDADLTDRYNLARLAHHTWAAVTVNGRDPPLGALNHTWI